MEESLPNYHEDHIAGKGDNSQQHYNSVLKFIPVPQAMKIPAAKQQWTKNGRNLKSTQRQCEVSKDIVDNYRTMFEPRISAGATEKLPYTENFRISSWSYDVEGHAKKCVERFCELANKTTQQL